MNNKLKHLTLGGMLIALGIVYGDIGTSPLYVMNSILGGQGSIDMTNPSFIIGSISLVFWTLMIITTIKYVCITMKAGNKGEGGIFALYALVRKKAKWLVLPALVGGAALLADGTLTPAVTVTSSIEGLKNQSFFGISFGNSQGKVLIIVTLILLILFAFQHLGASKIGKYFGPIMLVWFSFLAVIGVFNWMQYLPVIKALNPIYAVKILFSPYNKAGIFILGSIFLATTGAEALYSDMGNVGKKNIYGTWPIVYLALMLNYFGQGAWVINHEHSIAFAGLKNVNPFYMMIPSTIRPLAVIIATLAAIIASQALITGSYTLVDEAIGLKFLPPLIIKYPGKTKKQMYIGTVNWALCLITLFVVWFFGSSEKMEAAYGLAITVTMLMTSLLLYEFLATKIRKLFAFITACFFAVIEAMFLLASLVKFIHGGYVTLFIMLLILGCMLIWVYGYKRTLHYESTSRYVPLLQYRDQLQALSDKESVPLYCSNLVYLTDMKPNYLIRRSALYSILNKSKRAKIYWFVTIHRTNAPDESRYSIDMLNTRNIVSVQLYLGFKKQARLDVFLHQIAKHLIRKHVINPQYQTFSIQKKQNIGGFKFVLIDGQPFDLETNADISEWDKMLIGSRLELKNITASPRRWYGLQFSNVVHETIPLFLTDRSDAYLISSGIKHNLKR